MGGVQLRGTVHGGQQPVTGASIQLYAAGTTGYGSAATALLTSPVMTDAQGSFSISGDYTCPSAGSQLYIVAKGGNPGLAAGSNNPVLALMTALGPCSLHGGQYTLDPNEFITINEVTTVASVYALAAFMGGDATHVGTSSTNAVGLANSFQIVDNLVDPASGVALAVTPAGNGSVPQTTINTLGNILASCVNSDGTGTPCGALLAAATPSGGAAPADTIQAIYDVARNPVNQVDALYALAGATAPFQPMLTFVPNDWVLALKYPLGSGYIGVVAMAIDASGNAWIANALSSVTELSSNGTILSGANGYTAGGLMTPTHIAIDPAGNAWVTDYYSKVVKLSSDGTVLSGASGFTVGGSLPEAIALDGQGNAWVVDGSTLVKLDNSGNILSGVSGFPTGNMSSSPTGVGIDRSGNAWVGNGAAQTVVEFSNNGTLLSGSGYPVPGIGPTMVAFDGAGDAWVSNSNYSPDGLIGGGVMAKLSSSGSQLSPPGGYQSCISPAIFLNLTWTCFGTGPAAFALDGAGHVWSAEAWARRMIGRPNFPVYFGVAEMSNTGTILSGPNGYNSGSSPMVTAIAIDGGGDVWVLSGDGVRELIGAATPVVTPFSLGVRQGTLGLRP